MATCSWVDGDGDSLSAPFTLQVAAVANEDHIAECILGPITTNSTADYYPNTATAAGTYNSTTVTDISTAAYGNPLLSIEKSGPCLLTVDGDLISYSFKVTNTGGASLLGPVTVTDDKATVTCPAVATLVMEITGWIRLIIPILEILLSS